MRQHRLAAEDRRQSIVNAAREVFAQKGFDGTTTRDLAKAAGVSEALLYRHFPSKESLYAAMRGACVTPETLAEFQKVLALEPSASTLVLLTHFLVSRKVLDQVSKERESVDLLLVRSLLEDGEFARTMYQELMSGWHEKFRQSLKAAITAGDAEEIPGVTLTASWLGNAVCFGLHQYLRPKKPIVDIDISRAEFAEHCVRFILLGVGLKAEALRKYYNPKGLALLGVA